MILSNSTLGEGITNKSGHCGVVVLDDALMVMEFNGAAEEILGVPAKGVLGKSIYKIFPQNVNFLVFEYLIKNQHIKSTEIRFFREGKEKKFLFEGKRFKNNDQQFAGHLFLIYDITINEEIACTSDNTELMEQQYSFIIETMTRGMIAIDTKFRVTIYNGIAENIFGMPAENVYGRNIMEVFPDTDQKDLITFLTMHGKEFTNYYREWVYNGKLLKLIFDSKIIYDRRGIKIGVVMLFTEISELMDLQAKSQRLGELEQEYSFLLDTMNYGIIAINNDQIITTFNKAAEKLSGQKASDIIGKMAHEFIKNHPEEIKFIFKLMKRGGECRNQVFNLLHRGKAISIMADVHQLKNEDGQKVGAMLVLNDISQIKELQEKTKNVDRLEKLQSFILDSMNYGLMGINENMVINVYNKGAENILGVAGPDVFGKTLAEAFPDVKEENLLVKNTIFSGREYRNYVLTGNISGKYIEVMANTLVIKDNQGKNTGAVVVFCDVSEVRKQEQLLAQHESIASVSRLAAGLAHEIRNPLTSIKGFVQLLQNKLKEGIETEYLDIILEELERTNKLLSDFMLLAKPRKGQLKKIKVSPVLAKTIDFMKAQALLHDVDIRHYIDMELPAINGDEEQLKQVFINIIRNGIEAITEKGTILIKTEYVEDKIKISFTDNGVGIPDEVIGKIFHILYTTKQTGTGLGLSVSSQIIRYHGGKIEVVSKEGHGTTFTIILPINKD